MESLKNGMTLAVTFVALFISFYALLFIGLLVVGVIVNTIASGDVTVSGTYSDNASLRSGIGGAIYDSETSFNSAVTTLQNPVTVIISLLVVGVLMSMFFPQGFSSGRGKEGGVL